MTAPSTVTARSPETPPHSRSRGGSDAGSSGHPDRGNPPSTSPSADLDWAEFIAAARSTLRTQRVFRIHQLQQLDETRPDPATDPARSDVHRALREAARSALRDTEAALRRIQQGAYSRCPRCGGTIAIARLRALPMAPLCRRCQRATVTRPGAGAGA